MRYVFILFFLSSCMSENEYDCRSSRPWEYFDICPDTIKKGQPTPCPWPEKNGKCYPPGKIND